MHHFPVARARDCGRVDCYYWLEANNSADRACVFAIADFIINPARAGMQTHMDFMDDLFRPPPCPCWEPMATTTIKATAKRAKRLMGMTSVMEDTEAGSWEFRNTSVTSVKRLFL